MLLILLCLVSFGYVFTIYSSVLLLPSILQKYVLVFMSLINNLWLDFNFLSESISERFCSVTKSCLTLCDHMDCSIPGLPVHRYLLEFAQVNVHLRISGFNSLKFIVITGKVELCYTIFNIFGVFPLLFFSSSCKRIGIYSVCSFTSYSICLIVFHKYYLESLYTVFEDSMFLSLFFGCTMQQTGS